MDIRETFIAGGDLLTPEELAKRWDVTDRTLRAHRNDGTGPQFIILGKATVRYRLRDVQAFEERMLSGGMVPARAEIAMRRAASVLDSIAKWKMRPETLATVQSVRDGLLAQLAKDDKKEAA